MKTEESTPIAARMSKAEIMQFQECKAWYEEWKKHNSVHNWRYWLHRGNLTWNMVDIPVFTFETLYCWGEVVICPDDEQRTEILLNNSQVNYPDKADKEYCHMLLELVKNAVFHLYISKEKTSCMENEKYSDNNDDSIQNVLHNCVINGNENSLSVGGNVSVGIANIGDVKADRGGLMKSQLVILRGMLMWAMSEVLWVKWFHLYNVRTE